MRAHLAEALGTVALDNVTFAYATRPDVKALDNVSLRASKGETIALVGPTGAGKTTIINLLTRFYEIDDGAICIDGVDIRDIKKADLRRRLGLVKDDKEIFEKTSPITYADGLKDNLLLVHGILDDNVLFQDTARLMQRMIEKGKYFDLMAYPEDDHSIGKNWSRPHVFATVMRYLYGKLGK